MISINVYNLAGENTGALEVDEALLGGAVNPALLKQAYVRYHANRRRANRKTLSRAEVTGSTRKLYKQKGTGNARRGNCKTNIMRHGGHGHSKKTHSWRLDMPRKQRRLANRNAILAKAVDQEIKLVEGLKLEAPSTKQFKNVLDGLKVDRSCLVALQDVRTATAVSARNIEQAEITQLDRLNAFDLLTHRYLLADKAEFEAYLSRVTARIQGA